MAKRLTKRTSVEAPKALPVRGKEAPEPETYTCKDAETAIVAKDKQSCMGRCVKCKVFNSNSEVDHLCLSCHKEAAGFEFNTEKNMWIKKEKKHGR